MNVTAKIPTTTPEVHRKNIVRLLERASRRHHLWDVFGDFVEMAAIAVSNGVDLAQRQPREARYMALIRRYEAEEQKLFPQMLAELTMALGFGPDDILGKVFGELELGNAARGQFFTPYSVCALMARQQVGDGGELRRHIKSKGFITLLEPAVGAGAMVIAMAEALKQEGLSYQNHMHVTAQDIDSRAVHMSYLQLSLLHIPATIILGNTLAAEAREHWYTPAHIMGLWSVRLRRGYALGSDLDQDQQERAEIRQNIIVPVRNQDQLSQLALF